MRLKLEEAMLHIDNDRVHDAVHRLAHRHFCKVVECLRAQVEGHVKECECNSCSVLRDVAEVEVRNE